MYSSSLRERMWVAKKDLCKCLFALFSLLFSLSFPQLYCTTVERHKRNNCLLPSHLLEALICVFKKNDNLKRSGRKSPAEVKRGLEKKKRGVPGVELSSRGNMTAVAEGDVTRC